MEITLIATTENARVDALLREIVTHFEAAFPNRVRGYYVIGSYGDASSVSTSDLDLDIVFKRRFESDDERERARDLCATLQAQTEIELDLDIGDEEGLRDGLSPNLKLAGLCVYGEDIRDRYPLIAIGGMDARPHAQLVLPSGRSPWPHGAGARSSHLPRSSG